MSFTVLTSNTRTNDTEIPLATIPHDRSWKPSAMTDLHPNVTHPTSRGKLDGCIQCVRTTKSRRGVATGNTPLQPPVLATLTRHRARRFVPTPPASSDGIEDIPVIPKGGCVSDPYYQDHRQTSLRPCIIGLELLRWIVYWPPAGARASGNVNVNVYLTLQTKGGLKPSSKSPLQPVPTSYRYPSPLHHSVIPSRA